MIFTSEIKIQNQKPQKTIQKISIKIHLKKKEKIEK